MAGSKQIVYSVYLTFCVRIEGKNKFKALIGILPMRSMPIPTFSLKADNIDTKRKNNRYETIFPQKN